MGALARETKAVQNPALGAMLLWRASVGYSSSSATASPMPLPLLFPVLPIILHDDTVALLRGTRAQSGLYQFIEKFHLSSQSKTDLVLAVGPRALKMRPLSLDSLRLALTTSLLGIDRTVAGVFPLSTTPARPVWSRALLIVALTISAPALAQEAAPAPAPAPVPRAQLTGDWGGARTDLAKSGVKIGAELTGNAQGLISGDGDHSWKGGGRFDGFLALDSKGMGLWSGTGLQAHFEYRVGEERGFAGGALFPVNTNALLPLDGRGDLVVSSIYLTQSLGSRTTLMLGKINALDLLAADPFFGGWGNKRFMNMVFVAPPSGVVPPTIMGGVLVHRVQPFTLTAMVFDPHDRTDQYWVNGLFATGVNVSLSGSWSGNIAGRASSLGVTGTISTKRGADLGELLLPPDLQSSGRKGSFNIAVQFSHLWVESKTAPGKGLGIYAKAAIADGNPNPVQSSIIAGIAGHNMIAGRPNDSFGVGAFYYNLSDTLQSSVSPIIDIHDEAGIEAWYSLGITPWFRLTADVQAIDPATGNNSTAVVGVVRCNIVL